MTMFNEITKHYKLQRRVYSPPHHKLNRAQSVQWRQLQTKSYRNLALLHAMYPEIYATAQCKDCKARASLEHILWECQVLNHSNENAASTDSLRARWLAVLLSSVLDDQLWAIQRAEEAARRQDLLADT
uniref:Putative tick transposon n=1 Tax=Rhipicephalus microplus TaxID=6941 RepID=A0A6G5A7U0_RHIMP